MKIKFIFSLMIISSIPAFAFDSPLGGELEDTYGRVITTKCEKIENTACKEVTFLISNRRDLDPIVLMTVSLETLDAMKISRDFKSNHQSDINLEMKEHYLPCDGCGFGETALDVLLNTFYGPVDGVKYLAKSTHNQISYYKGKKLLQFLTEKENLGKVKVLSNAKFFSFAHSMNKDI